MVSNLRKDNIKPFVNSPHVGEYVDFEGLKLHYYEKGQGFPIILVHGIGQSFYTWRKNIDELSENHRVIALDLLGYGYSDKPDIGYSISDHANMILALMDSLKIEKAHIIGFSSGAIFCLDFLIRNSDRVEKLVIISPGGLTKNYPFSIRMLASPTFGKFFSGMLNYAGVRNILEDTFFDKTFVSKKNVKEYATPLMEPGAKAVLIASISAFDDSSVLENLRLIEKDVLIFWGEDDKWHVPEMSEIFHAAIKSSQLITIRNCGHMLHEEKYEKFNEEVIEFLK